MINMHNWQDPVSMYLEREIRKWAESRRTEEWFDKFVDGVSNISAVRKPHDRIQQGDFSAVSTPELDEFLRGFKSEK